MEEEEEEEEEGEEKRGGQRRVVGNLSCSCRLCLTRLELAAACPAPDRITVESYYPEWYQGDR